MKRHLTDEQRQAARDRMAKVRAARKPKTLESKFLDEKTPPPNPESASVPQVNPIPSPIATNDQQRRAKLAAAQASTMARMASTPEGRAALDRFEAQRGVVTTADLSTAVVLDKTEPVILPRMKVGPLTGTFRFTGNGSGLMVSELSPCICGAPKLKWHSVCLTK